jgi:hypothetical protein
MKISEALRNYGVLPRGCDLVFEDRDEEKELDKQTLRKLFQEEMALAIRNGYLRPRDARRIGIDRGLYTAKEMVGIPENFGEELTATTIRENLTGPVQPQEALEAGTPAPKTTPGQIGGNTMAEDAGRTHVGVPNNTSGGRLAKNKRKAKR